MITPTRGTLGILIAISVMPMPRKRIGIPRVLLALAHRWAGFGIPTLSRRQAIRRTFTGSFTRKAFVQMLERLTYCAAADPDQRHKGRWLNRILLSFFVLGVLVNLLTVFLLPPSDALFANIVTVLLIVAIYFLNRRGFVTAATLILLAIIAAAIVASGALTTVGLSALAYPGLLIVVV